MRGAVVWAALAFAAGTASARAQQEQASAADAVDRGDAADAGAGDPGGGADAGAADLGAVVAAAEAPPAAGATPASGAEGASDAFDRACVDLLHGKVPEGEKAITALRDACASLMSGRADERLQAERRRRDQLAAQEQLRLQAEGRVQPGQSAAQPPEGQGVLAAFGSAAGELTGGRGRAGALGMRPRGPVGYTLVTNPIGWFSGLGVNAELIGAFEDAPKFSWVAGARYSATDATNGTASTFGAVAGVDFFVIGRNNEGLRIGPRAELAAGRERFQGSTTFARLGLSGELGYNFIATNGITGLLAAGVGGRVAGDDQNDAFSSFVGGEFGPYLKVGVGYSW